MEVQIHSFLTSSLDGVSGQLHARAAGLAQQKITTRGLTLQKHLLSVNSAEKLFNSLCLFDLIAF
jgi:hypothetical protein